MRSRDEFIGLEFDWFAVDADGCVAIFSSAGYGPIPDPVFTHFDDQQAVGEQLCRLAHVAASAALQQQFLAFAAQGIYAYDWMNTEGPYRRYAASAQPATLLELDLPTDLQAAFVVLPAVRFSSVAELGIADLPTFTNSDARVA